LEDVALRINRVTGLSGLLPRTPHQLNSEILQTCALRFYVFHFEDELHGVFFSRGRWRRYFDVLRDFGRYGMKKKTCAASFERGPCISPEFIGWHGAQHLAIKTLHAFQIFYVEYGAAQLHIRR